MTSKTDTLPAPTSPTNTAPICSNFSLTSSGGTSTVLSFSSNVIYAQDPINNLKIKLYDLPQCGNIANAGGITAVIGQSYSVNELVYRSCNTAAQGTFSYSVVDSGSLESSKCNINLVVNSTPDPINKFCLKLKTLSLGSVGDLNRKNEEIELEIKSLDKQLDCGLFLFDIEKNLKDKNLNINIPCNPGDFVDIRFIERDNCNDDIALKKIGCDVTGKSVQLPIQITPDNTATSYTQCISSTKEKQVCDFVKVGIVGGLFCSAYQWDKEECGTTQVSETHSEYILVYEVVMNQGCDFGATNLQSNEHCYYDHYYPGPTCNALPNPTASSDGTTLDYSISGLVLCTFFAFYN